MAAPHADGHRWRRVGDLHRECERCALHEVYIARPWDRRRWQVTRYFVQWHGAARVVRQAEERAPACGQSLLGYGTAPRVFSAADFQHRTSKSGRPDAPGDFTQPERKPPCVAPSP